MLSKQHHSVHWYWKVTGSTISTAARNSGNVLLFFFASRDFLVPRLKFIITLMHHSFSEGVHMREVLYFTSTGNFILGREIYFLGLLYITLDSRAFDSK
jgi:hypothetical protein